LRQHVSVKRGRVVVDLDLQIACRVTGIERTEQWDERINNCLAAGQLSKIEPKPFSRRPKIENAICGQRRRKRIGIAVIQTEREPMKRVTDFVTIGFNAHELEFRARPAGTPERREAELSIRARYKQLNPEFVRDLSLLRKEFA
jgi:hypothetical protein